MQYLDNYVSDQALSFSIVHYGNTTQNWGNIAETFSSAGARSDRTRNYGKEDETKLLSCIFKMASKTETSSFTRLH